MSNYYNHPYCSNSALSKLQGRAFAGDPYESYRIGSLVDAVITEPLKLDLIQRKIIGTDYTFTKEEYEHAKKMRAAFVADPFCKLLLESSSPQLEVYCDALPVAFMGFRFELPFKGKFDLPAAHQNIVGDLKTTFATTQGQFEQACGQFDYWRQMYAYMQLLRVEKAALVGVSKKNFKVFKILIKKNDQRYLLGKASFEALAFKYWVLN
ncbi:MAG: PD-(D/E)XK nuclease-like domain-containing protein [Edaphocola sp.]